MAIPFAVTTTTTSSYQKIPPMMVSDAFFIRSIHGDSDGSVIAGDRADFICRWDRRSRTAKEQDRDLRSQTVREREKNTNVKGNFDYIE